MTLNVAVLLWAIAQVESGGNDRLIGTSGERSKYQISATVWRQHTKEPFSRCRGKRATEIATKHVRWLQRRVGNYRDDAYIVAYAYHVGLSSWEYNPKHRDYACRVRSLYWERLDQTTRKGP